MTKKHFELIAEALKSLRNEKCITNGNDAASYLVGYLSISFKKDNPNFDKERFAKATK
jgi:hypothetical protein